MGTIIFFLSLITVICICNADSVRNLGDKFGEWVNTIIDKVNRY